MRILTCFICSVQLSFIQAQELKSWHLLLPGKYEVGFSTHKDADGLLVGIWYPSKGDGERVTMREYIVASEASADNDTTELRQFKKILELPFLYHLDPIPQPEYDRALSTRLLAKRNATALSKKYPVIIALCPPHVYPETFEFFASHGYVVACIWTRLPDERNDSLLYVRPTRVLQKLLQHILTKPNVDTAHVAAFGHGGGIQPAFYLAMRSSKIKLLINLDGGVFGPRSKTPLSPDYHPDLLKIPMLYMATPETRSYDDRAQFDRLTNKRITVITDSRVSHHDFTNYGRFINEGLRLRGPQGQYIEKAYEQAHVIMLQFLRDGKLASAKQFDLFTRED